MLLLKLRYFCRILLHTQPKRDTTMWQNHGQRDIEVWAIASSSVFFRVSVFVCLSRTFEILLSLCFGLSDMSFFLLYEIQLWNCVANYIESAEFKRLTNNMDKKRLHQSKWRKKIHQFCERRERVRKREREWLKHRIFHCINIHHFNVAVRDDGYWYGTPRKLFRSATRTEKSEQPAIILPSHSKSNLIQPDNGCKANLFSTIYWKNKFCSKKTRFLHLR